MKKILIIDDEVDLSKMLKIYLEQEKFETFIASDGIEGLVLAQEERPDLILLDIMMPNLDGHAFLTKLRNTAVLMHTPVIVVTAVADFAQTPLAKEVDHFLIKPFNTKELLMKIKEILSDEIKYE